MEILNNCPLVSIGVITFNSAKTVIETLESIKSQTYQNLELIISDDGSKDNTVELCRQWLEENNNRFIRAIILTVEANTGISANLNRFIKAAEGYYSKTVAGDDILLDECISSIVQYAQHYREVNVFFTRIRPFSVIKGKRIINSPIPVDSERSYYERFNNMTASEQFRELLRKGCFLQAPTSFFKTDFLKNHMFIEMYKYEDDFPMWLRITREGTRIRVLFEDTMLYREAESLSIRRTDYYSRKHMTSRSLLFWNEFVNYAQEEKIDTYYNNYRKDLLKYELIEAFTQNHKSRINNIKKRIINFIVGRFAKFEL